MQAQYKLLSNNTRIFLGNGFYDTLESVDLLFHHLQLLGPLYLLPHHHKCNCSLAMVQAPHCIQLHHLLELENTPTPTSAPPKCRLHIKLSRFQLDRPMSIPYPNQGASEQIMSQPPAGQSLPYPSQGAAIQKLSQTQATPIRQTSPYPTFLPQTLPPASGGQPLSVSIHMTPPAPVEQPLPYPTHGAPVQTPPVSPASVGQTLPYPTNLSVSAQAQVEQTFTTYPILIKVRWQPSFVRPEAAVYYEVEMRPKKTFQILSSWKVAL